MEKNSSLTFAFLKFIKIAATNESLVRVCGNLGNRFIPI